ncbi:hypothetical protein G3823_005494 [Escherichia coli]|nr:hypothetical protein [Escherichia coli]
MIITIFIFICSDLFLSVLFESVFVCVFLYFSICKRFQVFTDTRFWGIIAFVLYFSKKIHFIYVRF